MVYVTLERLAVMCLPEFCQAIQIHVVHRKEYSLDLMIQDKQNFHQDHIHLLHAALIRSLVLCHGKVDQPQEVASTNEVHLDDNYSFSQILLGHPFWHLQTHYFVAMQLIDQHQDEHLVEAKELHLNNFQCSRRSHM